ncbi:P-loop containing nucleoside triphosphate hydrolase protein [Trichoderma sp. SZMC 28013]
MAQPSSCRREILNSQFGDNATIDQGNHTYNVHIPLRPTRSAIRNIPYPLNEDLVNRPDLMKKLNELLPQTSAEYSSAALWGLGGSGKTQIALSYAYQRCNKRNCSVFWVHADSEATFSQDYKTIAQAFGIDQQLKSEELYEAVRDRIAAQPDWVLILDNADDLRLFGVNQAPGQTKSLFQYIPRASTGTVLWTSRDAHITGTLVGSTRGIEVARMKSDEAETLLKITGNLEMGRETSEVIALLEELQWLPLAITQAGAYMRRTSTSAKEYSSLLVQSKRRWDILKANEFDRHRRPSMLNNVLETWSISIDRLRQEDEIAYNILNVLAYVANQNIPHELITTILKLSDIQPERLDAEATKAITRMKEFSFLGMQRMEDGGRSYEMHKLVQEAARYGLSLWKPSVFDKVPSKKEGQGYFSGIAVQVILDLFPVSEPKPWTQCEKYLAHAVQIGDWADLNEKQAEISQLFKRVSEFLGDRGRWREKELVDKKGLEFDRKTWGDTHQDTITSMVHLENTYFKQGRYKEAEILGAQVLHLRREIFGDKHPETIADIHNLATSYQGQGRYTEAEALQAQVINLRREILGDTHSDTIMSMNNLAMIYYGQRRYKEAEALAAQVVHLRRETMGDRNIETINAMGNLAAIYQEQGRYTEAEAFHAQVLDLKREILGDKHPDTITSMNHLAVAYLQQRRYKEAEALTTQTVHLRRETVGGRDPNTITEMGNLATIYDGQGRYTEAEALQAQVLDLKREILGKEHPDTLLSMQNLAITWKKQGRHNDALTLMEECVQSRRSILGPEHPATVSSAKTLEFWKSWLGTIDGFFRWFQ